MVRRAALLSALLLSACSGDDAGSGTQILDMEERRIARDASVVAPGAGGEGGTPVDPEPGEGGEGGGGAGGEAGTGGDGGFIGLGGNGGEGDGRCTDGETRPCPDACGVQRCVVGTWDACEESLEACDDADNDCDGLVDEAFAALGVGCQVQQGACSVQGIQVCNAAGNGVVCEAPPVEPEDEACDGVDNDCDNAVDEDFPGRVCCTEDVHCPVGNVCNGGECEGDGGPVEPGFPPDGGGASCANAEDMPAFGRYAGDNSLGGAELFGGCGGLFGPESVFTFTVAQTQRVQLDTAGSLADTVLSISEVCGDPFSELTCDDDGGGDLSSLVQFEAVAGVRYFVVVDTSLFPGPFVLNFGPAGAAPPPADCLDDFDCDLGDICQGGACVPEDGEPAPGGSACDAPVEMGDYGEYRGSTAGRANSMGNQTCQRLAGGAELVFTFQLDVDAPVVLDTDPSAFDTVLSVRTNCADGGSEVACNDDGAGLQSRVQMQAQAGVRYFVVVDGYDGESGDVVLRFQGPPRLDACMAAADCGADRQCLSQLCVPVTPAACAAALPADGPGPFMGDTSAGADNVAPDACGPSAAPEAIYAFVSPVGGRFVASTAGSGFDTILYVLAGCAEELVCNDDAVGTTSSLTFAAEPGQVYYVVVDGYQNRSGPFTLTIRPE